MPISLRLKNHDEVFTSSAGDKFLLNHQDLLNSESKEILDQMIMRNYAEDSLSLIPSCVCGDVSGAYYVGTRCTKCNTLVSPQDDNLSFLLWLERPQGVESFINPMVLSILLNRYKITKPNIQLIRYILLPNMVIDRKQQRKNIDLLTKLDFLLETNGIRKGYNSFVQNFFKIIEILEKEFSKVKIKEKEEFYNFLVANKDALFSNYLPFPNRVVFAIDSNELGNFIDKSLLEPINAMRRVTGIDLYTRPPGVKQTKVAKSLLELANFYVNYMENSFFIKPGLIRNHVSSARSHFTARGVITSISGPHEYDELYFPWSMACTLFRPHIIKSLRKLGYTYKQAVKHYTEHNRLFCPVINNIFGQILLESKGGVKGLFNRNPSLHRGSLQAVRITRIKTDVTDNSISMSYLIAKAFNADFDGDAMNFTLALTKKTIDQLENFEPHHNVLALSGYNEFSGNLSYPKTVISTLANWIETGRPNPPRLAEK